MQRAAADVMQSIIFVAIAEAIEALRAASRGVPNTLLRDLQSVHRNTTFADLPKELQDAIALSVRSAFSQLLKEGYSVTPIQMAPPARPPARHNPGERRPAPDRRPRGPAGPGGPSRRPEGSGGDGPSRGGGPGTGPGKPRRPRPPKGKPRLS